MVRILSLDSGCNLDPCCGYSFQSGARIIALINLGLSFFAICIFWAVFIVYLARPDELEGTKVINYFAYNLQLTIFGSWKITIVLTIYLLVTIVLAILARYLLLAVNNRDSKALSRWLKISTVLLALQILSFGTDLAHRVDWVLALVGALYLGYTIWVVWSFKKEVVLERRIHGMILSTENTRLRRPQFFTRL